MRTFGRPRLKPWTRLLSLVCLVGLAACGGGGGGEPPSTPPSIGDLSFTPGSVPASQAGLFTVTGTLSFSDTGGDLAWLTVRVTDIVGAQVSTTTAPIQGIAGQTSGTIVGSVTASTGGPGNYTIHVSVTDLAGARSNELSGPFDVVRVSSQGRALAPTGPGAASLKVSNDRLYWSESGEKPLRRVALSGGALDDLVARVVGVRAFAFVGPDLVWADDRPLGPGACGTNTVRRYVLRTSSQGVTTVLASNFACARTDAGIAVDASNVYWVSSTISPNVYTLNATPLTGGATTTVVSGFAPIVAVAVNGSALYWMAGNYPDPGLIQRRVTGTGVIDTVASFSTSATNSFAVDATNVYYTTANFPRISTFTETMKAQPLTGGPAQILAAAIATPSKIAAGGGAVAWIDSSGVRAMSTSGGPVSDLASTGVNVPLDVLINGGDVIWSETTGARHGESGAIRRIALAGGSVTTLVQGGDAPRLLGLDGQGRLSWSEGGDVGVEEGFSRVATLTASGVRTVLSGIASPAPSFTFSNTDMFVADRWRVKRLPIAGGMPETVAADDGPIAALTVDTSSVYWHRTERVSARKAPIAGGTVSVLTDGGPQSPVSGSPIHLGADGNLYWVTGPNALVSTPADGSGAFRVVAANASPCFTIDAGNAYMVFDALTNPTGIIKQPLSGAASTTLSSVWSSCKYTASLPSVLDTLVRDGTDLFWLGAVDGTTAIAKVSAQGGRTTPVLDFDESGGTDRAASIAVDAMSVYWIDRVSGEVRASAR